MQDRPFPTRSEHGRETARRERRRRRSERPGEAVRLQLEHVQELLALEALVLCDDLGEVVASAGRRELTDALAVQAPWLVATPEPDLDRAVAYLFDVYPGLSPDQISVRPIELNGISEPLIICGIGRSRFLRTWVGQAASGVHRILSTALH